MPGMGLYAMITLESLFSQYKDAFLQDMTTVLSEMEKAGISVKAFLAHSKETFSKKTNWAYEKFKQDQNLRREFYFKVRRCARCGNPMNLFTVNDHPGSQVGGEFKSMWQCVDMMGCGEAVYSDLPIHLEAEKYGLEKFFISPEEKAERRARRAKLASQQTASRQAPSVKRPCCGSK